MQPESSQPLGGPEQLPTPPVLNGERIPVLPVPESGVELGLERVEQTADAQAAVADATGTPVSPLPAPAPVLPPTAPMTTSSPAIAADDDLIEKEWVDSAKKIITNTMDDPHARTEQVNQLQKDYLKKRYGKELGAA